MGDTEISWTHRPGTVGRTWNPVQGCRRVSAGCERCYAERLAARFAEHGWSNGLINLKTRKWNGEARLAAHKVTEPLRWRSPSTVFVNSMSDLFYERFTNEQIDQVLAVMLLSPRHTFQVLTKRARRMREYFSDPSLYERVLRAASVFRAEDPQLNQIAIDNPTTCAKPWIWLGVSVENQEAADERIPELLRTPAAIRFLSCEPLIGPVDLRGVDRGNSWSGGDWLRTWRFEHEHDDGRREVLEERACRIEWVIAGCESGPGARTCEVAWLRSLRDQCAAAGVAYFLKQAVATELGRCGDPNNPNGDKPCGQRITAYVVSPNTASYSCGCTVEGPEDGACVPIGPGERSKAKGRGVIELPYLDGVQHAAFPGGSPMTPEQEQKIIDAAFGIAHELAAAALQATEPIDMSSKDRTLAVGFCLVVDRYCELATMPKQYRCGWCVAAAGGDQAAWQAAPTYDADEIRAHTKLCPVNPLVVELAQLRRAAPTEVEKTALRAARDLMTLAHANCANRADAKGGYETSAKAIAALDRLIGDAP